jgi:hypothetical protein
MRRLAGTTLAVAVLLAMLGAMSIAAAAPTATPNITTAKTLHFDVVFSPFFFVDLGQKGLSKGDQTVFHDQLFSHGKRVGDDGGSCTVVDLPRTPSAPIPINCTVSFRLPGGQLTTQGFTSSAPTKHLAVTGGTGSYQNVRGQATLVEFGNGKGSVTFHLIP